MVKTTIKIWISKAIKRNGSIRSVEFGRNQEITENTNYQEQLTS